jgi:hypothetical protein
VKDKLLKSLAALVAVVGVGLFAWKMAGGYSAIQSYFPKDFVVDNAQLATAPAEGFRRFTPLGTNIIRPKTAFTIYFEPSNLKTKFENRTIKGAMTIDGEVRNGKGDLLIAEKGAWKLPLSVTSDTNTGLTNLYASVSTQGLDLADGRYTLTLRITDDLSQKSVESIVELNIQQNAPLASTTR